VIGIVETHGRPATAELVAGLEQMPRKAVEYRGKIFYELDTDAVIARKPEWVLVDELAHTNVPGTRHAKRWQSVEEIIRGSIINRIMRDTRNIDIVVVADSHEAERDT